MDGFKHGDALWIEVCAGGEAQAAGDGRAQVRDDVTHEVGEHHHAVALRLLHEPHVAGVGEVVLVGDLRVIFGHVLEDLPPEPVQEGDDVVLVHRRDLALALGTGQVKGIAHGALGILPGDDAHAHGIVVRRPQAALQGEMGLIGRPRHGQVAVMGLPGIAVAAEDGAHAVVEVLQVFPDAVEVNGNVPLQGALNVGVELDGPQVDVLVQVKADLQDEPHLQHAGGHPGVARRAEIDGVAVPELPDGGVRQDLSGFEVVLRTVGIWVKAERDAAGPGSRLQHLAALMDDLGADAVALQQGNLILLHACVPPYQEMLLYNKK